MTSNFSPHFTFFHDFQRLFAEHLRGVERHARCSSLLHAAKSPHQARPELVNVPELCKCLLDSPLISSPFWYMTKQMRYKISNTLPVREIWTGVWRWNHSQKNSWPQMQIVRYRPLNILYITINVKTNPKKWSLHEVALLQSCKYQLICSAEQAHDATNMCTDPFTERNEHIKHGKRDAA